MPGTIGNLYTAQDLPKLPSQLFITEVKSVEQAKHFTAKLNPGDFLFTFGLSACTALAIWDQQAGVASLAHFDGNVSAEDVTNIVDEMLTLNATLANITFAVVGSDTNMTLKTVWNSLDPRLRPQPLPQLSFPAPDPPIASPVNVYYDDLVSIVFNGWIGYKLN